MGLAMLLGLRGQVGWGQVGWGQVGWGQVGWGQAPIS